VAEWIASLLRDREDPGSIPGSGENYEKRNDDFSSSSSPLVRELSYPTKHGCLLSVHQATS